MSPVRMAKLELAMRVVMDFQAAFNRHDVAGMLRRLSDDCVFENIAPAPDSAVRAGKETMGRYWQDLFRAAPRAHVEIEEIFGAGERCVVRWKCRQGSELIRGVYVFWVRNGVIRERLSYASGALE